MELKVRVEGFSRVVCGVTEQTTCQEVVIALAHAMGRTGRFTLIEKWRDNERPLLPTDCPIQVLNKWGEYASEVQLLLHQSDKNMSTDVENIPEQVNSKDKFSHNFTPPVKDKGTEIRRVLTFSGAHNSVAPSAKRKMVKQISTPNHMLGYHGKYKDQMYSGTILENSEMFSTNRDIDPHPTNTASAYYNVQSNGIDQIHPAFRGRSGNELPKQLHTYNDQTLGMNGDIPHRRNDVAQNSHRKSPYLVNNGQNVKYPTDQNIRPNPNSAHSYMNAPDPSVYQQGQTGRQKNVNTNSSKQNYMSNVNPQRTEYSQSRGASLEPNNRDQNHYRINPRESPRDNGFKSSVLHNNMVIPPQPETHLHPNKSILPVVQNKTRNSAFQPVVSQKNGPELYHEAAVNGDINLPVYNRFPVHNEAEEYDLDSNFPDVRPGQRKKPVLIEEYRMPGDGHRDQELVQADRQGIPDPELTKMQRLITSQQERIKIQESQLQEIESEISVLEDKEMEANQQLGEINKQITQLDKKNSELEVEISDLDSTKWVDLVESEKNAEKRLQSEIDDYQTKLKQKDTEIQSQSDKSSELESDITTEKSELEVEKKRVQEEEEKLNSDLRELKEELDSKDEQLEKDKKSLEEVEDELRTLVDRLTIQQQEVDSLEQELKTVNMEEFQLSPAPIRKEIKKNDSGEVVLKMLEGRVSPALGLNRKIIVSPISKVLSVSKNPNGVWV